MVGRRDPSDLDPRTRYEIWVSCDDCGDVAIAGEACVLFRTTTDVTLAFPCVECGRRSVTPVPEDAFRGLLERGFPVRDWHPPRELHEPRPAGPPFTWDDVLEAHELLQRTDAVVTLLP
jgi:hypothetical protein